MHHTLRPVCQPQNHIVVLAAVKLWAEQLRTIQEFSRKHAEMTDIIIGTQIINRIVRLKMHREHFIDVPALKRGFIAVYVICILLINDLHIFI